MNRQTTLAITAAALVPGLALGTQAQAAKPPKPGQGAVSIAAKPGTVVFGRSSVLSGDLTGTSPTGGVTVRLEQDTALPLGDAYAPTGATATTAPNGTYAFTVKPQANTRYRVVAQASPPVTSAGRDVLVRPRIGLLLSDSTPRKGSLVRFRGTVSPAHDGRTVLIQRRASTGAFRTVARSALRDAGTERSVYSKRLRISRDGAYRIKLSADADHVTGFSRTRTIDVH